MLNMFKAPQRALSKIIRTRAHHYEVCVIGGGPVGLLMCNLLAKYNVSCCIVEPREEPTQHPQAHFVNTRSMEILQDSMHQTFLSIPRKMPLFSYWRCLYPCHLHIFYSVTICMNEFQRIFIRLLCYRTEFRSCGSFQ